MRSLALVALLAGCASVPQGPARYLVIRSAATEAVVAQMVLPSAISCNVVLADLLAKAPAASKTSACSASPSPAMTTRTVLRDVRHNFLYEYETVSPLMCDDLTARLYPDPGTEIVASCRKI